jgi:hypothetical protein
MNKKFSLPSTLFFVFSVGFYLVSLGGMGFCVQTSTNCWPGYFIVPLGWLELSSIGTGPFPFLAWCANPLLIFAWSAGYQGKKKSVYFAAGALILGGSFFLAKSVAVSEAGGAPYPVISYGWGLWCWLTSLVLALVGTFLERLDK